MQKFAEQVVCQSTQQVSVMATLAEYGLTRMLTSGTHSPDNNEDVHIAYLGAQHLVLQISLSVVALTDRSCEGH